MGSPREEVIGREATLEPARAPIRVCYVLDRFMRAGTELRVLRLIEGLDRQRVRPTVCLLDGTDDISRRLEPADCPVLRLGIRRLRAPSTLARARDLGRFLKEHEAEVVEVYGRDATLFALPVARLAGVPRIVTTASSQGYWMTPFDRWILRRLRPVADATIANCEAAKDAVADQLGSPGETVFVLRNGIDLGPYRSFPAPDTRLTSKQPSVGLVANLRAIKDPGTFVAAAARLVPEHPDTRFLIAGDGILRSELELTCAQEGLESHLSFCGAVAAIPDFLRELDVAVLCSLSEGSSNALIEYMAAGLPVVATSVGGTPELIEDDVTGLLVPPAQPAALADAIGRLLSDPELRRRLGSAARERAFAEFDTPHMCARFEHFYRSLFATPSASRS